MRFRNSNVLVSLIAVLAISLVLFGCSSDEETTTTITTTNPQAYNDVAEQVDAYLDYAVSQFETGLDAATVEEAGDPRRGPFVPDGPVESDDGQYWYVLAPPANLAAGITTTKVDSIQFLYGGQPVENIAAANGLNYRNHYQTVESDTSTAYAVVDIDGNLSFSGLTGSRATINGTTTYDLDNKTVTNGSTVWENYYINATYSGISIIKYDDGFHNGCPTYGTAQWDVTYERKVNSGAAISSEWEVSLTWSYGQVTGTVTDENGNTYSYSRDCCTP